MLENLSGSLELVIKFLKVPVLVLAAILLYRLDRIIASGMHSAEMLERTAENVERSSETFYNAASILNKIPGVGRSKKHREVEDDE
ncbi:MAG: hypothetical protein ABEK10_03850 [Candidatus Nanosalina sp.]